MAKEKEIHRYTWTIDGVRREHRTTKEVRDKVQALVEARKSGVVDPDANFWARRLIGRDTQLYDKLSRWGLVPPRDAKKTIGDLCAFMQKRPGVKKTTLQTFQMVQNHLLDFWGADFPLSEITVEAAAEFVRYLDTVPCRWSGRKIDPKAPRSKKRSSRKKEVRYLSEASKLKRTATARQFFAEAVRLEWISKNPFRYQKGGSRPNLERMMYVSPEDTVKVLRETVNKKHKALISLWRFCGVRGAREFIGLDWSDRCIRWSTADRPGSITIRSPKTARYAGHEQRTVPLTPVVEACLRDWFDEAEPGTLKMFPGMTPASNPGKDVKLCFARCGIFITKPYCLRESFCTDVLAQGIEPMGYEEICGHSLKVGMRFYQIYHPQRKLKAETQFLSIWNFGENGESLAESESSASEINTHFDVVAENVER